MESAPGKAGKAGKAGKVGLATGHSKKNIHITGWKARIKFSSMGTNLRIQGNKASWTIQVGRYIDKKDREQ
jgi:hypothetical protein